MRMIKSIIESDHGLLLALDGRSDSRPSRQTRLQSADELSGAELGVAATPPRVPKTLVLSGRPPGVGGSSGCAVLAKPQFRHRRSPTIKRDGRCGEAVSAHRVRGSMTPQARLACDSNF